MSDDASAKVNSYVGRCKCGALAAAVVDIPGQEKETAKAVAEFIRDGFKVESMTVGEVRAADWKCKCQKDNQLGLGL